MAIIAKRISQLPSLPGPLQLTDIFPGDQSASNGTTYKVTIQQLADLLQTVISGQMLPYTDVTSSSQLISPNNGYTVNNNSLVTFTLPEICPYGALIEIVGINLGNFEILQNFGQSIKAGMNSTTSGITGKLQSTQPSDAIQLRCVQANTMFSVIGSQTMGFNIL